MGFFNDLGKKVADVSQNALEQGKDMVEITKLKSSISDEERKIKKTYEAIGKYYYETFKDAPAEGFEEFVAQIKAAEAKIEEFNKQIEAVKSDKPNTPDTSDTPE